MYRSREAPMDYEFTNRPNRDVKPVWAMDTDDVKPTEDTTENRSLKRTHSDAASSVFGFGSNQSFQFQAPSTPGGSQWLPPPGIQDVDMADAIVSPEKEKEGADQGALVKRKPRRAAARISEDDEDDENEEDPETPKQNRKSKPSRTSNHYTLNLPAPTLPSPPSVLPQNMMTQLPFILILLTTVVWLLFTLHSDIQARAAAELATLKHETHLCTKHYVQNNCDQPLPALRVQCSEWELCMSRKEEQNISKVRIAAEVLAEVMESFVQGVSWRSLAFALSTLSFLTLFVNAALSIYRPSHATPSPPLQPIPNPYANLQGLNWPKPNPASPRPTRQRRRLDDGGIEKIQ